MITKEQILQEAVKLGLTLTDAEVEQLIKDQKLPVKKTDDDEELLKELGGNKTAWEMIKDLRKENAEKRIAAKKAQDALDKINADKKKADDEAAKAKGEYEKLYNEALEKVSQYEPIVNEYQEDITKRREKVKSRLGDKWMESFSTAKVAELEALADKLEESKPGDGGGNRKPKPKDGEEKPLIDYKTMK